MNEVSWDGWVLVLVIVVVLIILPAYVYMLNKSATLGKLMAVRLFHKEEKKWFDEEK